MAQRGRQRKRGLMRMDAALDAMRAYGFPDDLIVKTVKELLEVYGEDGWPFIEDASYKVLIDTILEEVDKEEENKNDDATNTSAAESSSRGVHACSSGQGLQSPYTASSSNEVMDHSSVTNEANENTANTQESGYTTSDHNLDDIKETSTGDSVGRGHGNADDIEGGGGGGHGSAGGRVGGGHENAGGRVGGGHDNAGGRIGGGHENAGGRVGGGHGNAGGRVGGGHGNAGGGHGNAGGRVGGGHGNADGIEGRGNISCSSTLGTSFRQQWFSNSTEKRKPYHGWLTNDNNIDDQDLVELKPEPLSKEFAILLFGTDTQKKRKTMWDMKPENI